MLDSPVVGIAEAAMLTACTLGHKFGILDIFSNTKEQTENLLVRYRLRNRCASIRALNMGVQKIEDNKEKLLIKDGVPSFKLFMIYEGFKLNDGEILTLFRRINKEGGLAGFHAENEQIAKFNVKRYLSKGKKEPIYHAKSKPNIVEAEAVQRIAMFAENLRAPFYIFHLSTSEGKTIIEKCKRKKFPAFAETCTHYLSLTDEIYEQPEGGNFLVSPPLRKKKDQEALWEGLEDGVISVVGSDDASYSLEAKKIGDSFDKIPNGIPGVEFRLPILFTEGVKRGKISLERMVKVASTNPARLFGLFPRKGVIQVGSDADLVIFDPNKKTTLSKEKWHMLPQYNPFEGKKVAGVPETVISRGKTIIKDGHFLGKEGRGNFISRSIDSSNLQVRW